MSGSYHVNPGTWNGGMKPNRCMACGTLNVHTHVHPSAPHNGGGMCGDCFRLLCRFDSRRDSTEPVEQQPEAYPTEDQLREWLNQREATRHPKEFSLGEYVRVRTGPLTGQPRRIWAKLWNAEGLRYQLKSFTHTGTEDGTYSADDLEAMEQPVLIFGSREQPE